MLSPVLGEDITLQNDKITSECNVAVKSPCSSGPLISAACCTNQGGSKLLLRLLTPCKKGLTMSSVYSAFNLQMYECGNEAHKEANANFHWNLWKSGDFQICHMGARFPILFAVKRKGVCWVQFEGIARQPNPRLLYCWCYSPRPRRWMLQMCYKAHLCHLEKKRYQQGGHCCCQVVQELGEGIEMAWGRHSGVEGGWGEGRAVEVSSAKSQSLPGSEAQHGACQVCTC